MSDGRERSENEIGLLGHRLWLYLTYDVRPLRVLQLQGGRRPVRQDGNRELRPQSAGIGDIVIDACVDGITSTIKLNNVLHIQSFGRQLLSVAQMDRRGLLVELKNGKYIIRREDNVVATGTLHGALYILDAPQTPRYNEVAYVSTLQI